MHTSNCNSCMSNRRQAAGGRRRQQHGLYLQHQTQQVSEERVAAPVLHLPSLILQRLQYSTVRFGSIEPAKYPGE